MTVDLTDPIFTDEEAARAHFERLRWPNGPVCPHCGSVDSATELKGKSTRPGLYKCRECKKLSTAAEFWSAGRSKIPSREGCAPAPSRGGRPPLARQAGV